MKTALTIAGSDSSGGAGIQADLKTFSALGVYGETVICALTAQNTTGVSAIHAPPPEMAVAQLRAVCADIPPQAVKSGMLFSAPIIAALAEAYAELARGGPLAGVPLVVDPVMVASSGARLLEEEAVAALCRLWLPLATLLTPNIPEAEILASAPIRHLAEQEKAAQLLFSRFGAPVLLKGGHLDPIVDLLYDGRKLWHLPTEKIDTPHTHGTGCTLSAAITAYLALGLDLLSAVQKAKQYLAGAIANAPGLGGGCGPLQHHG